MRYKVQSQVIRFSWFCSLLIFAFSAFMTATAQLPQSGADRRVDVGGYSLHIKCAGSGSPVVVFESGLGGNADSWAKVMPIMSQKTRVCSYDRANVGDSDAAPRATMEASGKAFVELRSGNDVVRELHTLLANAGEVGPYVLVGHSLGGLYAILYAATYPSDLKGLVLEDSAHPDQVSRYGEIVGVIQARHDRDGLIQNEEGLDVLSAFQQVKSLRWHTHVPLVVVSQGSLEQSGNGLTPAQWTAHLEAHRAMQKEFLSLSSDSKWIVAEKSGHLIHRDQPELIVKAISDVLGTASTSSPPAH